MLHVPVDLFMYPPSSPTPLVAQRRRLYLPAVEGAWISYGDLPYTGYGDHRVRQTVQRTRKQALPTPPAKMYRFDARLNEEQKLLIQKAADLEGRTMTDFVLHSVEAAAERTIEKRARLILTARETEASALCRTK